MGCVGALHVVDVTADPNDVINSIKDKIK